MNTKILVSIAGWEERFLKGMEGNLTNFSPDVVHVLYSKAYAGWTENNRNELKQLIEKQGKVYSQTEHDFDDPAACYESVWKSISEVVRSSSDEVLFDATTATRELIWYLLHFLKTIGVKTDFIYYRASSYGGWLSRDAQAPHLVLKSSGVMYPDLPTCILALSGFDDERLWQLFRRYEPRKMLLGVQVGDQLENTKRNVPLQSRNFENAECFDFDSFDVSDNSFEILRNIVAPLLSDYNIIAASLGPKPGALSLFRLTQEFKQIGLVYIPAKEYCREYSSGIDWTNKSFANVF